MKDCKDLKISQMPKADHLHGGDLIPIVQHGHNKTINVQDLVDLFKKILPPPHHPEPCHHHDDPCEMDLISKTRKDAAIARASASNVEGKLDVIQKTSEVALNTSSKAINYVRLFKNQLDQINQIIREYTWLKAEVESNKYKTKNLLDIISVLIEDITLLKDVTGLTFVVPEVPNWLDELQNSPIPNDCHHHHHHHHHDEEEDTESTDPLDGVEPIDANDLLHEWGIA
jgi:hypothetical protein